ncbi:hypothetical protein ACFLUG_01835 [Chloroflexota bacterium]
MARAVIELNEDISSIMPQISGAIESCAYSPESQVLAFRFDDMRVIVEKSRIHIYGAEDEHTVKRVIRWIINKIYDGK